MKPRKAPGEDGIPADVWRAIPQQAVAELQPLLAKCTLYGREPLAWQGGQLHQIYKGAGPPNQHAAHRA
eukprot:650299-Alexandrium_andersonii.AAC.1